MKWYNIYSAIVALMICGSAIADVVQYKPFLNLDEEPIQPLQSFPNLDPHKIRLGGLLFNDTRLSLNETLSCASCHKQDQGGSIRQKFAPPGVSGKSVLINVPTIFNSGHNFVQFWNGRASTLEDQLDGPINNADEMGGNWKLIVSRLKLDRAMVEEFQKAYKSEPNEKNIKDAIASFERSLVLVNSPFDRYLLGDRAAITQTAERGYTLFKDLGCASCHQGQSVGGNMFQKFGIIKDYFQARGDISDVDLGRYSLTKNEDDRYVFKVPSLRNIDLTSPYFHDGSAETLEKAVDIMAEYQLGHTLSVKDRADIVAFLRSLTGEMPPP